MNCSNTLLAISASEAMPIKQLFNDLKGPTINDGDFAYTHNQVEIGHRWGAFELAIFWRYDYFIFLKDHLGFSAIHKENEL